MNQIKSNLLLQSLYYAEACNEFARPISASLRPGDTATPDEEMSQRWQAVGNTVSDLTGPRFKLRPPVPETNALPLDQLPGDHCTDIVLTANWSGFRVPGVLQRFAIAYLFAFTIQWVFHRSPKELHNMAAKGKFC